jgi:hypothetical protein
MKKMWLFAFALVFVAVAGLAKAPTTKATCDSGTPLQRQCCWCAETDDCVSCCRCSGGGPAECYLACSL